MDNFITNELSAENFEHNLSLVFQPIVDVLTGEMAVAEVLLRWHHPRFGLIPTDRWIAIAEQNNHIGKITYWVTQQVCRLLQEELPETVTLAINVSPLVLDDSYADYLLSALGDIHPSRLILEITETAQPENMPRFVKILNELSKKGIGLSLDDFGSGYSSMKYLVDIPVDFVKIDKEFVQKAPYNSNAYLILETLVSLGHEVGAAIVMEGVETQRQSDIACALGAQMIQGFFLSPPIGLPDLKRWTMPNRTVKIPILNQRKAV